jgi:thioredoxin 2
MADALNIVCPHCGAVNRAPRQKLDAGERPNCGRCHAALFDGNPADIASADAFERMVARNDVPLVVDFWAEWCGPCKMMAPQFSSAAKAVEPAVRFAKLDTEALPEISARLGIRGIPTMILFQNGREVARQSGAMDAASIRRWISGNLQL